MSPWRKGLSQMSVKIAIQRFSSAVWCPVSFELLAMPALLLLPAVYLLMGMLIGLLMLVIVNPPSISASAR